MKIKQAWIEQILEFESKVQYAAWLEKLKDSGKKYKVVSVTDFGDGVLIRVRKQYNNNCFPED